MLEYLRIRGLALIDDMELEFGKGMNVLTGETGAGKSFILKAINFVLGDKLSVDFVRPEREKAQVEALFSCAGEQGKKRDYILKREISSSSGRSHFFINDSLSSQDTVRTLRQNLLLHISQHGQQKLLQPSFQASAIDTYLKDPSLIAQKNALVNAINAVAQQRQRLREKIINLSERRELLESQLAEIKSISPEYGEEERLQSERAHIKKQEKIRSAYDRIHVLLAGSDHPGIIKMLYDLQEMLKAIDDADWALAPYQDSIAKLTEEVRDLSRKLQGMPALSPIRDSDEIESRLYQLSQLKRKLRRDIPGILSLKEDIESSLSFLDSCSLDMNQLKKKEWLLSQDLHALLETLNAQRKAAASAFCSALVSQLAELGFNEHVDVIPREKCIELWPAMHGKRMTLPPCEELQHTLLWAPNPGQLPQPLDKIASGGELSRFMLAFAGLQKTSSDSTLIFDEIDAGIGGVTLNRVADRLHVLSAAQQLIVITHWPQLAVKADHHFHVEKTVQNGETFTLCKKLSPLERQMEYKRMSGEEIDAEAYA